MKLFGFGLLFSLLTLSAANAAGWGSVHKYVKPSGRCAGQEVLASYYSTGKRTASGEALRRQRQHGGRAHLAARHHADRDQSAERPLAHRAHQRPRALGHRLSPRARGSISRAAPRIASACAARNISACRDGARGPPLPVQAERRAQGAKTSGRQRPGRAAYLLPLRILAQASATSAIGLAARERRPAALLHEAVALPGVGLLQRHQLRAGVGVVLEFVDADRRQRRHHRVAGALVGHLLSRAAKLPAAPAETDDHRDHGANAGALQQARQRIALQR